MAWDIDSIIWHQVRDKILKDRYAGCCYSVATSFSPIVIRHREPLPMEDRKKIQKLFPKWIRIEFQEVTYKGELVDIYGRGDMILGRLTGRLGRILDIYLTKLEKELEDEGGIKEYRKEGDNWV